MASSDFRSVDYMYKYQFASHELTAVWRKFINSILLTYCMPEDVRVRFVPPIHFPPQAIYFSGRKFHWDITKMEYGTGKGKAKTVLSFIKKGDKYYFMLHNKQHRFNVEKDIPTYKFPEDTIYDEG